MHFTSLVAAIRRQIAENADATALICHGNQLTYGEFGAMVRSVEDTLQGLELRDGVPVAILSKKSPYAIATIFSCLASNRPFLLPSVDAGSAVLDALYRQAGCRYLLLPERLGGPLTAVPRLDSTRHLSTTPPVPPDTGFMLTTSGSTGLPKIVPIPRSAVDRFVSWAGARFGFAPGRPVLNYSPLNFDICLVDIWAALAWGAPVALVDQDQATNPDHLLRVATDNQVTTVQAVPLFYHLLIESAQRKRVRLPSLEHVITTGESVPAHIMMKLSQLFPNARLYNLYGCTETNDSFLHEIDVSSPSCGLIPLGRPLPGVHSMIVDNDGNRVEGPGTGELYVTTPFQTSGYLDESLNNDKFVYHLDGQEVRRYFRSGDLVRHHHDGSLTLEGRNDFQVKVRGVRVNTQEVEQVLLEHREVIEAAVIAIPDAVTGHRLHAVVRRHSRSGLNSLQLRQHCAHRLTRIAIPSTLQLSDDPLPKTPTGKIDRNYIKQAQKVS